MIDDRMFGAETYDQLVNRAFPKYEENITNLALGPDGQDVANEEKSATSRFKRRCPICGDRYDPNLDDSHSERCAGLA